MANVPSNKLYIQVEDIDFRGPVSEYVAQKLSGTIQWIYENLRTTVIGEVQGAHLSEAQFQAAHGTGWILADGRSVVGSQYEAITTNSTVPDLRGIFIRMKNNGRSNPEGGAPPVTLELALGAFQTHQLGIHAHYFDIDGNIASIKDTLNFLLEDAGDTHEATLDTPSSNSIFTNDEASPNPPSEERPKNVTVNWFIRIN